MTGSRDFDTALLADKTVDRLGVSEGQVIWLWASTHSLDLIEALAFRIRERGAFWTLRLAIDTLQRRIGLDVPEPYLGLVPRHELRWLDDINAIVSVRDHGGHIPGVPLLRRRAMGAEWIALIDEAARRGCRRVNLLNPTAALASAIGIPLETLQQMCRRAVDVDDQLPSVGLGAFIQVLYFGVGLAILLLAEGQIKPIIAARFPILAAAQANALLESGQATGNIVLLAPELLARQEVPSVT